MGKGAAESLLPLLNRLVIGSYGITKALTSILAYSLYNPFRAGAFLIREIPDRENPF